MVKKYRKDGDVSYALGATLVMELLNAMPSAARCVYILPKSNVKAVTDRAAELNVPIVESEKAFNILSKKGNCFAIGEFDKFDMPARADKHHVVLVNPSDCGNLGTVMREIAAFDSADLVIVEPAADRFDPKTVRASMGAVFRIGVSVFRSFEQYLCAFPDRTVTPFMLDGAPLKSFGFEANKKYSLVFGNEATGLPGIFKEYGTPLRIEQSKKADSLNLSVAVAIGLYKLYVSNV